MRNSKAQKNGGKLDDLYDRIKNSELARTLKKELLIVARRGNQATRKVIHEFMNLVTNQFMKFRIHPRTNS